MKENKEAPFVTNFKVRREEFVSNLSKKFLHKLRSPVFDLPEFKHHPMFSLVSIIHSHEEFESLKSFARKWEGYFEVLFCCSDDFFTTDDLPTNFRKFDYLKDSNDSLRINELAVRSSGKILLISVRLDGSLESDPALIERRIIENEASILCFGNQADTSFIALTIDLFYLVRGLDELIENTDDSMIDLVHRCELTGVQVNSSNWPLSVINPQAIKNVRKGRILVNQASSNFKKPFF